MFYNYGGQRLKYSTGEHIHPSYWNFNKQMVKEQMTIPESVQINENLKRIANGVDSAYRNLLLQNISDINPKVLKEALNAVLNNSAIKKKVEILEWMEAEIEHMKVDKMHGSIQVYNALLGHLKKFSISKRYKMTFDSIDLTFYELFTTYLLYDVGLLTNTVGKQIKTLITFLNLATEKGVNKNLYYKNRNFKSIQEDVEHIYLNIEELDKIYKLDLSHIPSLDRVRDLFLIGCHTGLRFSDFTNLKKESFKKIIDVNCFNVKTFKTKERVVIPLKTVVRQIWDKYQGELPKAISNQKMNDYIKRIAELAGITENIIIKKTSGKNIKEFQNPKFKFVSTHSARRSFATNAFLAGVPTISIMKITGHKTESSFMKYIKVSQEENASLIAKHPHFA